MLSHVLTSVALEFATSLVNMNLKSDTPAHFEDMGAKLTLSVMFGGRTGRLAGVRRR